ncbi:MAG: tryptophan halogenase, partial [Sphingomonadales bacterium]
MSVPSHVIVVGEDAPLWLAASALHAALRRSGVTVEVVELPSRIAAAHVYVTQPSLEALHNRLGIQEGKVLRATRGSFALGQKFVDALGEQPPFFHAYGACGVPIEGQQFLAFWLKAHRHGLPAGFEDFSLTAAAALQGRMLLPDADTEIFGRTDYGYHLPAAAYARSLKALVRQDGVPVHEADAVQVERDGDGAILALALGDGRRVTGDLFVDASASALLAADAGWEDWTFAADRVLHARGPRMQALPAYGQVAAVDWGWASLHPCQDATHVIAAFAAADEARVLQSLPVLCGFAPTEVTIATSRPGRQANAWVRNCVAIGGAAARFDPLHGVDLLAVQLGLVHLLSRFPVDADFAAERHDYNQAMAGLFGRLRDFQSAHYRLARYAGGFWDAARAREISPELAHKIQTFAARGELAMLEEESFLLDSWQALFLGHGLIPDSWAPAIDRTSPDTMRAEFRRV